MEDMIWKKDETPYLVFPCSKCHQFTYVKTTRKYKKCARCGRLHTISKIMSSGEIVNGISTAVEVVKNKQDNYAIRELGTPPEFRTFNDFKIVNSIKGRINKDEIRAKEEDDEEYCFKFKHMLHELSCTYSKFPFYIIEMMAEKYNIPNSEVKLLVKTFQKQGLLIRLADNLYQVNLYKGIESN
ncbi:MAG: hypothetical protein ACFFCL_13835 [Promethearchaeota archaeon]